MKKKPKDELAKPLGYRVYKKHLDMLGVISKNENSDRATALRSAIEEKYTRIKKQA